jgi:hypothetical protein
MWLARGRKRHDDGSTKMGLFSGLFRLGVSPWSYNSARGWCFRYDLTREEDDREPQEQEESRPKQVEPFVPRPSVADPQHGDVTDNMDYRGCGVHVLELLDPFAKKFLQHKTWEEYGYTVPPAFSDAPLHYFGGTGATSRLVYVPVALEQDSDPALRALVARLVEERRVTPAFVNPMSGELVKVDVNHLDNYCVHFEEGQLSGWYHVDTMGPTFCDYPEELGEEEEGGEDEEGNNNPRGGWVRAELMQVVGRIRKRNAWTRKLQGSLVHATFGRLLGLPRDISKMIGALALAAPDPRDALAEPHCEDCSCYVGRNLDEIGLLACETCQLTFCKHDAACTISGHSATHRHLSRMKSFG